MKVNAYLVVAISVAAYLVGREVAKRRQLPSGGGVHPLPPAPTGPPGLESAPIPGAASAWDSVMFDVDVFPAGADRSAIVPPWSSDLATASTTCDAIAVGEDWWGVATADVSALVDGGASVSDALDQTLGLQLPQGCAQSNAGAYALLRDELEDRLVLGASFTPTGGQAMHHQWAPPPPQGPGNWGPQANPGPRPVVQSIMSLLTGFRVEDA